MKIQFLTVLLLSTPMVFADSIRFTERLVDRLVTDSDLGSDIARAMSATLTAVITVPGFDPRALNDDTSIGVSIGNLDVSETLGNADISTATNVTFIQQNDAGSEVGRLTLSYAGNVVTISGYSRELETSIVADSHTEETAGTTRFTGEITARISLDDYSVERTVYYKGTNTVRRIVGGYGDETFLNDVQLSGQTDDVRPTIAILSPLSGSRLASPTVAVTARAGDNVGVASVVFLGSDDYEVQAQPVEGTNLWTAELSLAPGTNVIRARSMDLSGKFSTQAVVKVFYVFPLSLSFDASKGVVTGLSNGQYLIPGATYRATAAPNAVSLFTGWSGDVSTNNRTVSFVMEQGRTLQANFVANPWLAIKGAYVGLFCASENFDATNSGLMTLTLTGPGTFAGRIQHSGTNRPFSGAFALETQMSHVRIARGRLPALQLELHLDTAEGVITGQLSDSNWISQVQLARAATLPGTNATPFAGRYTFTIPGAGDTSTNFPGGHGVGAIVVGAKGGVTVAGTLGDSTPFAQTTITTAAGRFPMYASLYGGRGLLLGWVRLGVDSVTNDLDAPEGLKWLKPALSHDNFYPHGFSQTVMNFGARYTAPRAGSNALNWTSGEVLLVGGNLSEGLSIPVTLSNNVVRVQGPNTNNFVVTFALPTGFYSGSFKHPDTARTAYFKGALLQPHNMGQGWFRGTNLTGSMCLCPQPGQ